MAKLTIIDDDEELTENLSIVLEKEGHTVSCLDNTEEAIDVLKKNRPDLLILDVMFPENPAAGFDLAREIRKTPAIKGLPIILLTSVNQELPMDFSAEDIDPEWMPVQDFVEKPCDYKELLTKVEKLLKAC
ncbi:MAG: response regulator [Spirochaetota bacterium]